MAEAPGEKTTQIATWFWIVGGVALVWNLLGFMAFVMQLMLTDDIIAQLPVEQQELYKNMPAWVTAAFGVAVICGVLGCVGLLMRKKWAVLLFMFSFVGILAQQTHMYFLSDTMKVMGISAVIMPVLVLVIAILLILFSMSSIRKGLLR